MVIEVIALTSTENLQETAGNTTGTVVKHISP